MKIASVKQPWASLIVRGVKDIENRSWSTIYRGPLLVHASLKPDQITSEEVEERYGSPTGGPYGCVVGIVDLVDVRTLSTSRWFSGPWVVVGPECISLSAGVGTQAFKRSQANLRRVEDSAGGSRPLNARPGEIDSLPRTRPISFQLSH
jgi:hypothetical protein